jgi:hypothetical protein
MRWLLVFAIACGSSSERTYADSAYVYELTVVPTGNTAPLYAAAETDVEYDTRAEGQCIGRGVEGEPFRPRKSPHLSGRSGPPPPGLGANAWLAPVDRIAVSVIVRSGGRELVRGCTAVALDPHRAVAVEVELK